jgi:hypothetical protein
VRLTLPKSANSDISQHRPANRGVLSFVNDAARVTLPGRARWRSIYWRLGLALLSGIEAERLIVGEH